MNRAETGPGDTSETESEKWVFALFGTPGAWGSLLQTRTPVLPTTQDDGLNYEYSSHSSGRAWLYKLFLGSH